MPSFRSTSTGELPQALSAAIAAALDVQEHEVQLTLGEGALAGPVTVHLEVEQLPAASTDDEPGAPTEPPQESPLVDEQTEGDRPDAGESAGESADESPDDAERLDLDAEADAAADFLEGLLDALDLPGDLKIHVAPDQVEIELLDIGSGVLIGRRGQTLDAIQELVRCVLQREFQRRSRVLIDAEGYRARRLEKLLEKAEEAIDAVLDSGEPERLEPMDVFERKAVHNLVSGIDGITSRSQGREPARRIVLEAE